MREILFRGQTRRYGEKVRVGDGEKLPSNWVYGGIFPGTGDFSIIYGGDSDALKGSPLDKHVVYSDTVGQYTGAKDRSGRRIFEGDILRIGRKLGGASRALFAVVRYENNAFILEYRPGSWDYLSALSDPFKVTTVKIKGNIYDNPEFLGGENDG